MAGTQSALIKPCETCQQSVQAGMYPQCLHCLWYRVKPCDVVPHLARTIEEVRRQREQWLQQHPGWTLLPHYEGVRLAAPTQSTPLGVRQYQVEYIVLPAHRWWSRPTVI